MNEAQIIINGTMLTVGQSMALRVAVVSFHTDLHGRDGNALGDDQLRDAYIARLEEVLHLIIEGAKT